MDILTLCNEFPDIIIENETTTNNIINLILEKYSDEKTLHYMWSGFENNITIKIKADNGFYKKYLYYLLEEIENIHLLIDKECISNSSEHILCTANAENISKALIKYYWELDEIYLFDSTFEWLISVNHNFEVKFAGNIFYQKLKKCLNDENIIYKKDI